MTTPDLRLEGTPSRALGASLRAYVQPPCVGRGPFVFQKPGFAYRLPHDGGVDATTPAPDFTWTYIAAGSANGGADKKAKALTESVAAGDAVALWPGLVGYTLNTGCAPVAIVLVVGGDGDALVWPLKAYAEGGLGAAAAASAGGGGENRVDGATRVDAECAARCGLAVRGEAKGGAKGEAKTPAAKGR